MLYVFYGTDTIGVREKAFETVERFQKNGYRVEKVEGDTYQYGLLQDAAGATSLFGEKSLYIVDTPSSNEEMEKDLVLILEELPESKNVFVIIEGPIKIDKKNLYKKYVEEIIEVKANISIRFNAFQMADALLRKDKKSLWLLFIEARKEGMNAEEIIGVLWWQLKVLRLVMRTGSAKEAGLKEFSYNKAKEALSKFKNGEIETTARAILSLYHEGHCGSYDINIALERFVLEI